MKQKDIPHSIAELARAYGFLHETNYRDFCIIQDFLSLTKKNLDIMEILELSKKFDINTSIIHTLTHEKIEIILSNYHNISPESIHRIIYSKKKKFENVEFYT